MHRLKAIIIVLGGGLFEFIRMYGLILALVGSTAIFSFSRDWRIDEAADKKIASAIGNELKNRIPQTEVFLAKMARLIMEDTIIADANGRILIASPSAAKMAGYTPEELSGQPISILIPQRFIRSHELKLEGALTRHDGLPKTFPCELLKKDKTEKSVMATARVLDDPDGLVLVARFVEPPKGK